MLGDEDVMFVSPPEIDLPLDAGTRVSLYPMAPVQVRSTGLCWSTDGLSFAPDGQIGTSNQATGPVTLLPVRRYVGRFTQNCWILQLMQCRRPIGTRQSDVRGTRCQGHWRSR